MTATEVRAKRAEADANIRSHLRLHNLLLAEHRETIRQLQEDCPHEHTVENPAQYVCEVSCEDCGALLAL